MFGPYIRLRTQSRQVEEEFPSRSIPLEWPEPDAYNMAPPGEPSAPISEVYGLFHQAIFGQVAKAAKDWNIQQEMSESSVRIADTMIANLEEALQRAIEFRQFARQWGRWVDAGCHDLDEHELTARPSGRGQTER